MVSTDPNAPNSIELRSVEAGCALRAGPDQQQSRASHQNDASVDDNARHSQHLTHGHIHAAQRPTPNNSNRHIDTTAQIGDLAPVAPDKVCKASQRRVARQNGVFSRAKQAPDTRHAAIDATRFTEQTYWSPVAPKDLSTFKLNNVCELRAEALTRSNSTTRTE
ncbi:hypothetical protein ACKAV7_013096 [Fusarium commune]